MLKKKIIQAFEDELKNLIIVTEFLKKKKIKNFEKLCDSSIKAINKGNKIIFFGNGGSASDAQHIAAEFVGRYSKNRMPLNSLSLNTDTSVLTCIANDFGYENIFSRQLEAISKKNDLLICFSTSGNSSNILKAIEYAQKNGLKIITFLGKDGGKCIGLTKYEILIPSNITARIQEMHITIAHIICEIIDEKF